MAQPAFEPSPEAPPLNPDISGIHVYGSSEHRLTLIAFPEIDNPELPSWQQDIILRAFAIYHDHTPHKRQLVLVESLLDPPPANRQQGIEAGGASGLVQWVAKQVGMRPETIPPDAAIKAYREDRNPWIFGDSATLGAQKSKLDSYFARAPSHKLR